MTTRPGHVGHPLAGGDQHREQQCGGVAGQIDRPPHLGAALATRVMSCSIAAWSLAAF
nr:hypothetical protein [Saccharopolyspora sp. ASAGF58]